ncbi:cytochrome c oxidase subunit 6A, mitochondrial [Bradysia coprophila]|uniref:cytochrome c oxidase subunit 6A, mitochondrial n=1 Tax=Bradysia coprophila TaxID=38358 RepID=UPI00187DAC56|nr:cytochrome c oxidase subunit 6A, mitochondrial [Bradysia coprophila]
MASIMNFCARRYLSLSAAARNAVKGPSAVSGSHEAGGYKLWKRLTFFVAFPACGLCMLNAYLGHQEDHHKPRQEFVKYDYLRVRTKRFPWGDGNKSLFHNPHVNALPDGYETDAHH